MHFKIRRHTCSQITRFVVSVTESRWNISKHFTPRVCLHSFGRSSIRPEIIRTKWVACKLRCRTFTADITRPSAVLCPCASVSQLNWFQVFIGPAFNNIRGGISSRPTARTWRATYAICQDRSGSFPADVLLLFHVTDRDIYIFSFIVGMPWKHRLRVCVCVCVCVCLFMYIYLHVCLLLHNWACISMHSFVNMVTSRSPSPQARLIIELIHMLTQTSESR